MRILLSEFLHLFAKNLPKLIWLNMIFLVFCLGLATIGLAAVGMASVLKGYVTSDKPEATLGGVWDGMTAKFTHGLFIGTGYIILLAASAMLVWFYITSVAGGQIVLIIPLVVSGLVFVFIIFAGFYLFLALTMDIPLIYALKSTAALAIGCPGYNFAILGIFVAILGISYLLPILGILFFTFIGLSFMGLLASYICYPNLEKYITAHNLYQKAQIRSENI